jgi:hypothetical protein
LHKSRSYAVILHGLFLALEALAPHSIARVIPGDEDGRVILNDQIVAGELAPLGTVQASDEGRLSAGLEERNGG